MKTRAEVAQEAARIYDSDDIWVPQADSALEVDSAPGSGYWVKAWVWVENGNAPDGPVPETVAEIAAAEEVKP